MEDMEKIEEAKKKWRNRYEKSSQQRDALFQSISGEPVEMLYTPDDVESMDYLNDLGFPGEYPFTRGVRENMYRGRLWTMRQFSGFGTAMDFE